VSPNELERHFAHARLRLPRERFVLVQLAGGEPLSAVICPTERAARDVAEAAGLSPTDYRIIPGRDF